jgi:hypothetical protein
VLAAPKRLVERTRKERERSGKEGKVDLMDVLLGNRRRDLAEIGYTTLRVWERRMRALAS